MSPRKLLSLLIGLCQAGLLAGGVVLNRLAYEKMGVMRHVSQRASLWERTLPLPGLLLAGAVLMLALALAAVFLLVRRGFSLRAVLLLVLCLGAAALMLLGSKEQFRAFYYLAGVSAVVCLLQLLQCTLLAPRKKA